MPRMSEKDYKCAADEYYADLKRKKTYFMDIDEQEELNIQTMLSEMPTKRRIGKYMNNFRDRMLASNIRLSDNIFEYYKETIPKVRIEREPKLRHGEAFLINFGNGYLQVMILPSKPFREIDFLAYCHEYGHCPYIAKNVEGEYFDFNEAFSIFLEFCACREIDEEHAIELFKDFRLQHFKNSALTNFKIEEDKKNDGSNRDRYLDVIRKENSKYFTSLELALGLDERIKTDRDFTIGELEAYINREKSMREVSESLDIDTTGYKRLRMILPKK